LWRTFQATKAYDVLAAGPLILWYGASAGQLIPALAARLQSADVNALGFTFVVSVLAQTAGIALIVLALVFLLLRGPAKAKAKGAMPRIMAIAGTYLGVAVVWLPAHPVGWRFLVSPVAHPGRRRLAGFALFISTIFQPMAEARRLVTNGPYGSIVIRSISAKCVDARSRNICRAAALGIMAFILLQFERMKNEEQVLTSVSEYEAYRVRTRGSYRPLLTARFIFCLHARA
jgi:hypothetical protein